MQTLITPCRRGVPPGWFVPEALVAIPRGTRGALCDLQVACAVGRYELDLLVREMRIPRGIEVTGQVTLAGRPDAPAVDLPLALVETRVQRPVSRTTTDEFGEFTFVPQAGDAYGLRLGRGEDAPCVLVWEAAA